MKESRELFLAVSPIGLADHRTGQVLSEKREKIEEHLSVIQALGYTVFCSISERNYQLTPGDEFETYETQINRSDGFIALFEGNQCPIIQYQLGIARHADIPIVIAYTENRRPYGFLQNFITTGKATSYTLPFATDPFCE